MSREFRATFIKVLIGKSIFEGLIVTALAASLLLMTTNRALHGWLEQADARTVSGWAVDDGNPASHAEVQLFIDGNFVEQKTAEGSQSQNAQANTAHDRHGFVFKTPLLSAGEHEARVYVVHRASPSRRTLQMIGNPIRFRILP
jgi:hypothetical protein